MVGCSMPFWWPYRRASLIAASFASQPELQKNSVVHAGQRAQQIGQLFLLGNVVPVGSVDDAPGLLGDGLDQTRMGVTQTGHGDAGEPVQIALALGVPQPHAFAARESHGQPAIGVHQVRCPGGVDQLWCHGVALR